jgi:hypothetical protein
MKKKWMPHIIAAGAFVVFIVLGFACATMTPEQKAEYEAKKAAEEAQRVADGKGGKVLIRMTTDDFYVVLDPLQSKRGGSPTRRAIGYEFTVLEDGEYTIRFRRSPNGASDGLKDLDRAKEEVKENGGRYWSSKSVYVSGYNTFTVNIP